MCTLFTELQDGERGVWAPQHQQLITQRLVGAPIATSSLLLYLPLPPPLSSPGPRVSFTPPRLDGRRLLPESQGARAYWKTWGKIAACINNSKGEGKGFRAKGSISRKCGGVCGGKQPKWGNLPSSKFSGKNASVIPISGSPHPSLVSHASDSLQNVCTLDTAHICIFAH